MRLPRIKKWSEVALLVVTILLTAAWLLTLGHGALSTVVLFAAAAFVIIPCAILAAIYGIMIFVRTQRPRTSLREFVAVGWLFSLVVTVPLVTWFVVEVLSDLHFGF
jgi:hypothetical protein